MAGRKFNMGRQNEQVLNKEWHDLFMALKYLNNERYHNAETVQERQEQIPKRALRFQPDTLLDVIEVFEGEGWSPLFKGFYHPANTNQKLIEEGAAASYQLGVDPNTGVLSYMNPDIKTWMPVKAQTIASTVNVFSGLSFQFLSPLEASKTNPNVYPVPLTTKGRLFTSGQIPGITDEEHFMFCSPFGTEYDEDSDITIHLDKSKISDHVHWIHLDTSRLHNIQKRFIKIDKDPESVNYGYIGVATLNTEYYGFRMVKDKDTQHIYGDPRGFLLVKERTKGQDNGDYVVYNNGIKLTEDAINKYDYIYTITYSFIDYPTTLGRTIQNAIPVSGPCSYYVGMFDGFPSLFVDGLALESKYSYPVDKGSAESIIYEYDKSDGNIKFSVDDEGNIMNDMQMTVLLFPERTDDYTFGIDDEDNSVFGSALEYNKTEQTVTVIINEALTNYEKPMLFCNGLSMMSNGLIATQDIDWVLDGNKTRITIKNFDLAEGELYTFYVADVETSFVTTGRCVDGVIEHSAISSDEEYIVIVNGLLMTPTNGDIAVDDGRIRINSVYDITHKEQLEFSVFRIDNSDESALNLVFDGDVASYSVRIDDGGTESVYNDCSNAVVYLGNAILLDRDGFRGASNSAENYYKPGQITFDTDDFGNEIYYIHKATGDKELLEGMDKRVIEEIVGFYVGKGSINVLLSEDQINEFWPSSPLLTYFAHTYCNQLDEPLVVGSNNNVQVQIGQGDFVYRGKASRFDVWLTGNNSLSTYYNGLMIANKEVEIDDGTTRTYEVTLPKLNIPDDKVEILQAIYEAFKEVENPEDLLTDDKYADVLEKVSISPGKPLKDVFMTLSLLVSALQLARYIYDELNNESIQYVIEHIEGQEIIAAYRDYIDLETNANTDHGQIYPLTKETIQADFLLAPAIVNVYLNGVLLEPSEYHKFDDDKIMFESNICGLHQLPETDVMAKCLFNEYLSDNFKESIIKDYENYPKRIIRLPEENDLYYIPTSSRDTVLVEKRNDLSLKSVTFDVLTSSYGTLEFSEDYYDIPRSLTNTIDHVKIYINGVLYKGEYELVTRHGVRGIRLLENNALKIDPLYEHFSMFPEDWTEHKHLFGTEKYERKIDKITFEWR